MHTKFYPLVILIAVILLSLAGCSKDEPTKSKAPANVVGTWRIEWTAQPNHGSFTITFKSDFTYTSTAAAEPGTFDSNGKKISWMMNNIYYSATVGGTSMSGTLADGNFIGAKQ
ncbi:MAG TPA: hypothetical protein PLP19_21650 [bacterium]|nr:hypothetical protein [bacterium]HPN46104.1 hypothetical protein [bacterium]